MQPFFFFVHIKSIDLYLQLQAIYAHAEPAKLIFFSFPKQAKHKNTNTFLTKDVESSEVLFFAKNISIIILEQ